MPGTRGAWELKRQAKLEHWRAQIIDCHSSGMSVRGMVCGTQYFDKDVLPLGKENPLVGSRGTCAHRFSSAATGSLVELPLLPERQTVGGVVASIQNGKGKADNYSGADTAVVRTICQVLKSCWPALSAAQP